MAKFEDGIIFTNSEKAEINLETKLHSIEQSIESIEQTVEGVQDGTIAATNAKNVSSTIAGKAITDIFEKNGTTVKNATNANRADSATNVTTNINGKKISGIFEDNGTTVKNATNASTANVANSVAQVGRLTKLWSGTWDGESDLVIKNLTNYGAILVCLNERMGGYYMLTRGTAPAVGSHGTVDSPTYTVLNAEAIDTTIVMRYLTLQMSGRDGEDDVVIGLYRGTLMMGSSSAAGVPEGSVGSCTAIYGIESTRIPV